MSEQKIHPAGDAVIEDPDRSDTDVQNAPFATTRRAADREVVSYLGIVMLDDNQFSQVDLVDLSAAGARLVTDDSFETQGNFVLKVPETGACFLSEVVWKRENTYGVRFLRPSNQ